MAEIKNMLREMNPWWNVEIKIEFRHREIYEEIKKFINTQQIIAFTGLRRTGKTTLMLKIAEDFIRNGFDAKNIIYFSFDELKGIEIRDIIRQYEQIMNKDTRKEKHLLILDEVQKLNGWNDQLKAFYDTFKNFKILISGSESLFIRKKSQETLAGRIFEFKIEPLTFKEFLYFKGAKYEPLGLYEKELIILLGEYMLTMGFPEMVNKEKDVIKKYVKESVVEKIVYKDIPSIFRVKDIGVVESLLNIFMNEPGQIIEISGLAKELKISRQAASNYLRYLEDAFIIKKLYNFSFNRRKIERKLKKYYPVLVSPALLFKEDDASRSKIFEWLVVTQLGAEFFWRDPSKNEVDAVLVNGKTVPVEVKYGKIDTKGIEAFMRRFNIKEGYIISYNKEQEIKTNGMRIHVVPAYKFLLQK